MQFGWNYLNHRVFFLIRLFMYFLFCFCEWQKRKDRNKKKKRKEIKWMNLVEKRVLIMKENNQNEIKSASRKLVHSYLA